MYQVFQQQVAVVAVICAVVKQISGQRPQLVVFHVSASASAGLARLQVYVQQMAFVGHEFPSHGTDERAVAGIACSVRLRGCLIVIHNGGLALVEVALSLDVRCHHACPYCVALALVVQPAVYAPGAQRAAGCVGHSAQSLSLPLFRNDVDDAHVAVGLVSGRRRGQNLQILYCSCRNLLQGLCAFQGARLAVNVHQEVAASAQGHVAVGINGNRGDGLQHIQGRTSARGQIGACGNAAAVQAVHHLSFLSGHGDVVHP